MCLEIIKYAATFCLSTIMINIFTLKMGPKSTTVQMTLMYVIICHCTDLDSVQNPYMLKSATCGKGLDITKFETIQTIKPLQKGDSNDFD